MATKALPNGDFDYFEHDRQLKLKQQLADKLSQPLPDGQMVSGWYVAPSKGATIANALSQALGGYMKVKLDQEEGQLAKKDTDFATKNINKYLYGPSEEEKAQYAKEAEEKFQPPAPRKMMAPVVTPGQFQAPVDPSLAGPPSMPGMEQVDPTDLARVMPPVEQEIPPTPEELQEVNTKRAAYLQKAIAASKGQAMQDLAKSKIGRGWADRIINAEIEKSLAGPQKLQRHVLAPGGELVDENGEVLRKSPDREKELNPIEAQRLALQQKEYERRVKNDQFNADVVTGKVVAATDKVVEGRENEIAAASSDLADIADTKAKINAFRTPSADGKTKAGEATGLMGFVGDKWTEKTGISTAGSRSRSDLFGIVASGRIAVLSALDAKDVPAAAVANTKTEMEGLIAPIINADPTKQSAEQLDKNIDAFYKFLERQEKFIAAQADRKARKNAAVPSFGGVNRAVPSTSGNVQVPGRGQRAPDDIDELFPTK